MNAIFVDSGFHEDFRGENTSEQGYQENKRSSRSKLYMTRRGLDAKLGGHGKGRLDDLQGKSWIAMGLRTSTAPLLWKGRTKK